MLSTAFSWQDMWALFDGDEAHLNIARECLDRHDPDAVAARIVRADGRREEHTFGELSRASSQVANWLEAIDIAAGEPVAVMMEPSARFYATVFGILKRGAVVVPLYTLFGPEAIRDRLDDCGAQTLIADRPVDDLPYRVLAYGA